MRSFGLVAEPSLRQEHRDHPNRTANAIITTVFVRTSVPC